MRFCTYDPSKTPSPVLHWYDTDIFHYENIPTENVIPVSDAVWEIRLNQPMFVKNNELVYTENTPLDIAKRKVSGNLSYACARQIVKGFICNILGDNYIYPNNRNDQSNLTTAGILAGQTSDTAWRVKLWCKKDDWVFMEHDKDQVIAVMSANRQALSVCQEHLISLQDDLDQATTADAALAIVWSNPDPDLLP